MNIFVLLVVFAAGEPAQSVAEFLTADACWEAKKAYTNAFCRPEPEPKIKAENCPATRAGCWCCGDRQPRIPN